MSGTGTALLLLHGRLGRRCVMALCLWWVLAAGASPLPLEEWRNEVTATRALAEYNVSGAFEQAERLSARLPADASTADRVRALNLVARIALYRAHLDDAAMQAKRALTLAQTEDDRIGQLEAHLTLALNALLRGDADELVATTAMAVATVEETDRPELRAEVDLRAAMMHRRIGHAERAMTMCFRGREALRHTDHPLALAYALQGVAQSFAHADRHTEAHAHFVQMVEAARAASSRLLECEALVGAGEAAGRLGRWEDAETRMRAAITLAEQAGAPSSVAAAKLGLARVWRDQSRLPEALSVIEEVVTGYVEHPNPFGLWSALGERSEIRQRMRALDLAMDDARQALKLAETIGLPSCRRDSAVRIAELHAAAGRPETAYEQLLAAAQLSAKLANENLGKHLQELARRRQQDGVRSKLAALDARNREQQAALREHDRQQRTQWLLLGGATVTLLLTVIFLLRDRFDIRSLRRQRTELAATQLLHAAVIDGANTTLIATRSSGLVSVFNAGAEKLLGYRRDEVVGLLGFMHFVDTKAIADIAVDASRRAGRPVMGWDAVQEGLADGGTVERELLLRARDGRAVPTHLRITPLRNPDGALTGLLFAVRDLTAERAAAEELARTYSQLATIFETTPDGFLLFDREGKMTDCNAAAERIFGLNRAEMLDRGLRPADWEICDESGNSYAVTGHPAMAVLRTGEPRRGVIARVRHVDGRVSWLSSNVEPLREANGTISGAVASVTDITTLKAAERTLREHAEARVRDSESRFRILADLMPCVVTILSPEGVATYCNSDPTLAAAPGAEREPCRSSLASFHPDDRAMIERVRVEAFAQGKAHDFETRFRRSDAAEWRWHRFNVVPQRDAAGAILCWLSVGVDIHEHRQSAAALERAVAERTAELRASESRFHGVFEHAPVSLWECDGTALKRYFDELRVRGVVDLGAHLEEVDDAIAACFGRLKVLDVNQAAEALHKAPKTVLIAHPRAVFHAETVPFLRECLLALWNGRTLVEGETVMCTQSGSRRYVQMSVMVQPGFEKSWGKILAAMVDVTAPRAARQALLESRERLGRIFDTVSDGLVLLDGRGRVLECNAAAAHLLGVGRGAETWLAPERRLINARGEPMPVEETAVALALQTGTELRDGVMGFVRPEMETIWVLSHVAPYRDARRDLAGVVWSFKDITLTRQREALIRESEERFRLAFEQGGVGMGLFLFPGGRWLRVNRAICEMVGRTAEELADQTVFDLVHPEDRSVFTRSIELWRNGDALTLRSEGRLQHQDGHYITVAATCSLVHDDAGQPLYVFAQMENVTAQRQAEMALLESQARLGTIFQAMGEGIIVRDAEGRIVDWNSALERIGGIAREQIAGREEIEGVVLFTETGERLTPAGNPSLAALRTGQSHRNRVVGVSRGERPTRWWLLNAEPLRDGEGRVRGVVTSIADISDQKRAEQELRAAHTQAVEALRIRSAFLATVSHEIRTPMNGILGTVEVLATTQLNSRQREISRIISQSAHSLLRIIDDLLDLSRIESGKLHVEISDFNPRGVIEDTVALFRASAEAKGLELLSHIAAALDTTVRGDPIRFRQVLTNLLNNAVKFTHVGQVTIAARAESGSPADVLMLHVEVRDTGCGVPASVQEKLFTPFVQAESAVRRQHAGAGLGLAISGHLVELMGGQIGFSSSEGRGSTFWFKLALTRKAGTAPIAAAETLSAEVPARSLRILVVEDNEAGRFVARLQLEHLGHQVDMAEDGQDALQRLASATYDAVLMDCQMPRMDGYEATRRIRAGAVPGLDTAIPIIALTAFAMPGDRERGLAIGMNDYVTKPLTGDSLRSALIRCGLTSSSPAAAAETDKPREEAPFDRSQLAQLAKISAPDGRPLSVVYAAMFCVEMPTKLDEIDALHRARNGQELARSAHSLAGNAANLGANPLRAALRSVIAAARVDDWTGVEDALARVHAAWERLREALEEILPPPSSPP